MDPDTFICPDEIKAPLWGRYFGIKFSINKTAIEMNSGRYWMLHDRVDYLMHRYIRRHNIAHTSPPNRIHLAALEKMFGMKRSKQDVMVFINPV